MKAAGITALFLTLLLTGCGWQLRGTTQAPALESVSIQGGGAELKYGLEDELGRKDVLVHSQSPYLLIIEDQDWHRRTAAVDSQGRQAEIELRYEVRWHLEDRRTGALLTTPQRVMSLRSFAWYPDNATASSDEESLVRDDLHDDLIYRIINQLANLTQGWETY